VAKENIRQAAISEVIRLLRKERERQKMSMNQLAEHSGLSQSMISLLERGTCFLSCSDAPWVCSTACAA